MKINLPQFFYEKKLHPFFKIDDTTIVDYKVHTSNEIVYAYSHTHLLIFILSGKKIVKFLEDRCVITSGELAFIKKGNCIMNQILNHDAEGFESIVISLSDEMLRTFAKQYTTLFPPVEGDLDNVDKPYFIFPLSPFLQREAGFLQACFQNTFDHPEEIIKLKLYEWLIHLVGHENSLKSIIRQISSAPQTDLKQYMEEHFDKPCPIQEHAQNLGMSMSSFKRKCEEELSETPGRWIRNKRLKHSQQLLATSDYNVTEICFLVGFESLSHFIKCFKKEYGFSPGQYRKEQLLDKNHNNLAV